MKNWYLSSGTRRGVGSRRGPITLFALAASITIAGCDRPPIEQSLLAPVASARSINTAGPVIILSGLVTQSLAAVTASQEKLDSESRLFQTGESTNFLVLTRQNELLESRRRAVVAQLEFNKAAARLEQAKGETLETYKISVR